MDPKKRRFYKKKRYALPIILIVVLIAIRIALPYILKNYVNKVLADIPGYTGHVEDIDLSLIRGAYVIHGLYLHKVNAGSEVPFLDFDRTDISLEWKSLFKGRIVSEIVMNGPKLYYVFEDHQKENTEDADIKDWTDALTDLVPIDINHLEIHQGKVAFIQFTTDPEIDLHMDHLELYANNLRNVVNKDLELPSDIHATAVSIGNGKMALDGKMDLVREIPNMDLAFSLTDTDVRAFNDFTEHYSGLDFDKGDLNVYSEVAIADGYLTGYIKPILKDSKLLGKEDSFLETLWEGFVGFFKFILKNHKENTLATKVPLEGDLNKVKSKIWPTIGNIFKNAWISAFKNTIDDDVDFEDAEKGSKKH